MIGALEIEIMNAIWLSENIDEDFDISVNDVVLNLEKTGIQRAYTTIKTVMDRLVSKDILVRYKNGKKFYYKSAITQTELTQNTIEEVCSRLFNSNMAEMLRFIENECKTVLA